MDSFNAELFKFDDELLEEILNEFANPGAVIDTLPGPCALVQNVPVAAGASPPPASPPPASPPPASPSTPRGPVTPEAPTVGQSKKRKRGAPSDASWPAQSIATSSAVTLDSPTFQTQTAGSKRQRRDVLPKTSNAAAEELHPTYDAEPCAQEAPSHGGCRWGADCSYQGHDRNLVDHILSLHLPEMPPRPLVTKDSTVLCELPLEDSQLCDFYGTPSQVWNHMRSEHEEAFPADRKARFLCTRAQCATKPATSIASYSRHCNALHWEVEGYVVRCRFCSGVIRKDAYNGRNHLGNCLTDYMAQEAFLRGDAEALYAQARVADNAERERLDRRPPPRQQLDNRADGHGYEGSSSQSEFPL